MNFFNTKFETDDFSTIKNICSLGSSENADKVGQVSGTYNCLGRGLVGNREYFVAIGSSLPNELGRIAISPDGLTWYVNAGCTPLEGVTSSYRKIVFYKSLAIVQTGEKILIIKNFIINDSNLGIEISNPIDINGDVKDIEVVGDYLYILTSIAVSKYEINITETNDIGISHVKDYGFVVTLPPSNFAKSSNTLIAYKNTDSIPVFYRIDPETDQLESFSNIHAFRINSAIVIGDNLIIYGDDKNVYDIDLNEKTKLGTKCVVHRTNNQWIGNPIQYNGYIYNAHYNIFSDRNIAGDPYVVIVMSVNARQLFSSLCTLPTTSLDSVDIVMNESAFCFLISGTLYVTNPAISCNKYRNWNIAQIDCDKDLININVSDKTLHLEYKLPDGNYDSDILELRFMQGKGMKQFVSNVDNGIDRYFVKDNILHIITNENFDDIEPYSLALIRSRVKV